MFRNIRYPREITNSRSSTRNIYTVFKFDTFFKKVIINMYVCVCITETYLLRIANFFWKDINILVSFKFHVYRFMPLWFFIYFRFLRFSIYDFIAFYSIDFIQLIHYLLLNTLFWHRENNVKYFALRDTARDHEESVFYSRAQSSQKFDMRSREGATCRKEFLRRAFYFEDDIGSTVTWHTYFINHLLWAWPCKVIYIQFSSILFLIMVWYSRTIVLEYLTQ